MKLIKGLFLALVIIGMVFVAAGSAKADCSQYGKVVYSYVNATYTTPYAYFYIACNTTMPTYYYYYYTNKHQVISQLTAAQAGGNKVRITGTSSTCPTSGSLRYGGVAKYVYTYTNY